MSDPIITKKQHYVPKFYLRRFSDYCEKLQVLDIRNNRLGAPKHYSAVAYSHFFYAVETGVRDEVSQQVERWLQYFEDKIAKEISGIIDRILNNEHIDNIDRRILAVFMCMLYLCSPNMRVQLNKMQENMTKQIMSFYVPEHVDRYVQNTGASMSAKERADLIQMMEKGTYNLRLDNSRHLKFMTKVLGFDGSGFADTFLAQKWNIYIAKGKKRFITSDAPVVEWWPPPQNIYGVTALERNRYFALTPEIFFELTDPIESDEVKYVTLYEKDDGTVTFFNIVIADRAHDFAYAKDREPLDNLISGRAKPGVIERAYCEQFQLPWVKAKKEGRM